MAQMMVYLPLWRRLGTLLVLVLGIVLSPLRGMAATVPTFFAYDAVLSASTRIETRPPLRFERSSLPTNTYDYDGALDRYDSSSNPRLIAGVAAVHEYDDALERADSRELRAEGSIYGAADATTAAEGLGVEANAATKAIDIWGESTAGAAQVRVLQTGGRTITSATADALNEANGMNLTSRQWGRALEALKGELRLPNNFHGAIDSVGNYSNPATGEILGNILEYLP